QKDFALARRAAYKVEKLEGAVGAAMRLEIARLERNHKGFEEILSSARTEKTRGNYAGALAGFERALALAPDRSDIQVAYHICQARVRCAEGRHLEELGILDTAAHAVAKPEERAEVDGEQDRTIAEL